MKIPTQILDMIEDDAVPMFVYYDKQGKKKGARILRTKFKNKGVH